MTAAFIIPALIVVGLIVLIVGLIVVRNGRDA